jgi:hypothetical protein
MALLESHEVAGFVVGFAVEPAPMKDADPLEGESTKRCLMGAATFAVALVEGLSPEGARDSLAHPFDESLALEGWAREAPVDPALVAAALGDGSDADVLLQGRRVREALSSFTEGHQQTRSQSGTGTGERVEELVVGELGAERSDLCIEAFDGGVHSTELRDGGLDEQQQGCNDGGVGRQRLFGLNGREASRDGALAPYVVTSEEVDERVLPSALRGVERRPAFEKCGEDGRVLVAKPAENLGEVSFQSAGESIRDGDTIIDERSSKLDHSPEAAHVCALGLEARQPVGIPKKQLEGEFGIARIVLCTTRREGLAILGEEGGLDGEEHEDVVLEKRGDDGALSELQGDRDGGATETLAQLLSSLPDGDGAMLQNRAFALLLTRDVKADVVLLVGPVDADKGGNRQRHLAHEDSFRKIDERDMQSQTQRSRYGEPVKRLSLSVRCGQGTPAGAKLS